MSNKINLIGRWTKDCELKGATTTVLKGNLAVKRRFKREGEPDADFFRVTAFNKAAETIMQYAGCKGDSIVIWGHVQTGSYDKDGVKIPTFDVLVDEFEFIGNKPKAEPKAEYTPESGDIPF